METKFEKQILDSLSSLQASISGMKEELNLIKERIIDDSKLSEEDIEALDDALIEEKKGKLLTKDHVFV